MRTSSSKTRGTRARGDGGFTLVEVIFALAILGLVAVVLLDRRIEVVRDAGHTRDQRLSWTLAAWKMGEIERDTKLFEGNGESDSGGFEELSADYAGFAWEYEAKREEVKTNDPENPEEKPKEVMRVRLKVRRGDEESLVELDAMFAIAQPQEGAAEPGGPK